MKIPQYIQYSGIFKTFVRNKISRPKPQKVVFRGCLLFVHTALNIIKAIKEQPDPDKVHFAYVGTVAMTGSRLEPVHFGRIGDPMNPSKAAEFRGGAYLEGEVKDIYTPVKWRCAFGHEFEMSVNAVLHGGHWCPECLKNSWAYPKIARENPFYAQVWDPQHSPEETYEIPMKYSAYEITNESKKKLGLK